MKGKLIAIVVILLIIAGTILLVKSPGKPGKLDSFASCVKDSGAIFYGAFWCPHCRDQKALFGKSIKNLTYVECSTPDSNGTMQVCVDKNIKKYPTWDFKDGSRVEKVLSLEELAQMTSCTLP